MSTAVAAPASPSILGIETLFSDEERAVADRARAFVDAELRPGIEEWYARGAFPRELATAYGRAGLLGTALHGYGCPGRSAVEYGLVCRELEACDSGARSFASVQGSLAMEAIFLFGSEEQKTAYLPPMARGELIGCFGLTEPHAGSDPAAMRTTARRDGGDWVIDGYKRWSTNAGIAGIAVVWCRSDEGLRGFIVPTDAPGFEVRSVDDKLSLRASVSSEFELRGVRVPEANRLPGARSLGAPLACLNEARFGIVWGVVGAARDCLETVLAHATRREAFGKPLAAFQLTQKRLVDMQLRYEQMALVALHLGRLKDAGGLAPAQVSFGKLNNCREALEIARTARGILGGDGVTQKYPVMRHLCNLETVITYEGTEEIHTLVVGQALTGVSAFG